MGFPEKDHEHEGGDREVLDRKANQTWCNTSVPACDPEKLEITRYKRKHWFVGLQISATSKQGLKRQKQCSTSSARSGASDKLLRGKTIQISTS